MSGSLPPGNITAGIAVSRGEYLSIFITERPVLSPFQGIQDKKSLSLHTLRGTVIQTCQRARAPQPSVTPGGRPRVEALGFSPRLAEQSLPGLQILPR